ncbi:MAG: hypothetical protein K6E86_09390 [Bacteroidales bacterium]|nr:hypothetical protein [Bacteroidales bacterium]
MKKLLFSLCSLACGIALQAQDIPLVYDVENTAATLPDPVFPTFEQLPYIEPLTDPFEFSDGSARALEFKDWTKRRGEIKREIEHYEIGTKPIVPMDSIEASMDGNTLTVITRMNGATLTQTITINYPKGGEAPYPLMIGTSNNSLPSQFFSSRNIATCNYAESQVNGYSQFGGSGSRGTYPFDKLYPDLSANGAYSEWAWGFSRILDGLQKLGPEVTKIDMAHIGCSGCSYAGKMALFCGAFDERVALTIAQEPGGGGAAAWRTTRVHNRDYTKEESWEGLDNTDYSWFMQSLKETFAKDNTFYLPYDHHELAAMCCPRALLMLGNPDYRWLADGSGYVSMAAARKVWEQYGIADRCGYSIVNGHGHCQLPESQYPEVEAFIDRFLLGKEAATDNVQIAPFYQEGGERATPLEELGQWMDWWGTGEAPLLPNNKPVPVYNWGQASDMTPASAADWTMQAEEGAPVSTIACATNAAKYKECPDRSQALKFSFEIATAGDYFPYAYVNCAKTSADAVYISVDEGAAYKANGANTKGSWAWKNLYALLSSADKTAFGKHYEAGQHTLYIYACEPGYKLAVCNVCNTESLDDFKTDIADVDIQQALTGIDCLKSDSSESQIFSIDGVRQSRLQPGVNIIRKAEGSTKLTIQ